MAAHPVNCNGKLSVALQTSICLLDTCMSSRYCNIGTWARISVLTIRPIVVCVSGISDSHLVVMVIPALALATTKTAIGEVVI